MYNRTHIIWGLVCIPCFTCYLYAISYLRCVIALSSKCMSCSTIHVHFSRITCFCTCMLNNLCACTSCVSKVLSENALTATEEQSLSPDPNYRTTIITVHTGNYQTLQQHANRYRNVYPNIEKYKTWSNTNIKKHTHTTPDLPPLHRLATNTDNYKQIPDNNGNALMAVFVVVFLILNEFSFLR